MAPQKILVCGGREYGGATPEAATLHIWTVLDAVHAQRPVCLLISGGARGVDFIAERWAIARGIDVRIYSARWKTEGRAAGPNRNQRMLDVEHTDTSPIDLCVAFAGNTGTADMIKRAILANIVVETPDE